MGQSVFRQVSRTAMTVLIDHGLPLSFKRQTIGHLTNDPNLEEETTDL